MRTERLDWLLIYSRRHLEHVLRIYIGHYIASDLTVRCNFKHRAGRVREDAASR